MSLHTLSYNADIVDDDDGDDADLGAGHDADDNNSQEAGTSGQNRSKRRLIQRRTRRVRSKLSGRNAQRASERNEEPVPATQESVPASQESVPTSQGSVPALQGRVPSSQGSEHLQADQVPANNPPNRHLKYLLQTLRSCNSDMEKARFMLEYVSGCSFNAAVSPDSIIRFSEDEAAQLSQYVLEVDENDEDIEEPEVLMLLLCFVVMDGNERKTKENIHNNKRKLKIT